jgi:hypothetical protein
MGTLSQTGIPGIGSMGTILQPKAKNKWRVIFNGLGGSNGATAGMGNSLSLQAITVSLPSIDFEEVQLDRYNSRAYVAGKHTFDPCAITIENDITNRAANAIQTQLEMQQKLIGASGPWLNSAATANTYKFGVIIELLDGNETVTEAWKLEGAWIKSTNFESLDYSDGGKLTIDLSIRFDHARQILNGAITGSALGGNLL